MYKNLNCNLLGISGRQSEIIELALTYGFRGIDLDIHDLSKRCERTSFESATRFLTSSKLHVGGFEVPINLDSDEDAFEKEFAELPKIAEIASRCATNAVVLNIPRQTDRLPYPEYFEVIRTRISRIAEVFAKEEVKVALAFSPLSTEDAKQFKFIQDVEGFVALSNSCKQTGIVLDAWAWYCGNGTLDHLEQIGLERVYAVRLADCVEGVAPGAASEQDCVLPGATGVIDSAAYLRKLVEAGSEVPVSAQGRQLDGDGKRDQLIGATQDALNEVFVQAGLPSQVRKPELIAEASFAGN